jgi:hypothetical protein
MDRSKGGPIRKSPRHIGRVVVLLYRLHLNRLARWLTRRGNVYIVGERGPEWFIPATSGTIVPHRQSDD